MSKIQQFGLAVFLNCMKTASVFWVSEAIEDASVSPVFSPSSSETCK